MQRYLLGSLAATVAVVVWGMIFWAVLYQFVGIFGDLPNSEKVAAVLAENGTPTGTYFYPWPRNTPETRAAWLEKHARGPFFKLSYIAQGVDSENPGKIALGVFHNFVVVLMAGWLLVLTGPSLNTFRRRFGVVVLAGSLGTVLIRAGDPIWFHLPWLHALGNAIYEIVFWVIAGAILAAVVKPEPAN